MPKYLSAEYMDLARSLAQDLPATPGASARVQQVVTGTPEGDVRYYTVYRDGRAQEQALGADADADLTLTTGYDDAVAIARGELEPEVAFMQGRVKVVGSMATVMALLPATNRPEHASVAEQLRSRTEF